MREIGRPLKGIRVVGLMLGVLGANVIKVELK